MTEPLISKYTQIVDDKLDMILTRLNPIAELSVTQINALVLKLRTKARRFKWDHTGNIFNHLASQWLIQNLPVRQQISSFEHFTGSLAFYRPFNMTPEAFEAYLIHFYKAALSVWIQLKDPSLDEVQLAMLEIVAKAINSNLKLERETFAQALYDILLVLINKKNEIITEDNFVKLMRNYMGILWKDQPSYYRACSEYYEFAKHFILIDFPNKKHSYFKNFHAILQGKLAYFCDHLLSWLEKLAARAHKKIVLGRHCIEDDDELLLELDEGLDRKANYGDFQKYLAQLIQLNSAWTRTKVLGRKTFQIGEVLARENWVKMKQYAVVGKIDSALEKLGVYGILSRIWKGVKVIQIEIITPNLERGNVYVVAGKERLWLIFENLKGLDLKKLGNTLKNQIEFLRESMLIFYEGLIEVKLNSFSLETLYTKIRNDIVTVYREIHRQNMEPNEENGTKMSRSMELYQNAVRFFRRESEKARGKEEKAKELEEIQEESKEFAREEESLNSN